MTKKDDDETDFKSVEKLLHIDDDSKVCKNIEQKLYTNLYYYSDIKKKKKSNIDFMKNVIVFISSITALSLGTNIFFINEYTLKNYTPIYKIKNMKISSNQVDLQTLINDIKNEKDIKNISSIFNEETHDFDINIPNEFDISD